MTDSEKKLIADNAQLIVNGFAFTYKGENIEIVDLGKREAHVMIIDRCGKMLESCMDPIEQEIALRIWHEDCEFMEALGA